MLEAIIFGAGEYGKELKRGLEKYYRIKILAICDNDEKKWGGKIEEIPIISPQNLGGISFEKIFICVEKGPIFRAIEAQLLDLGIPKEKIVIMQMSAEYQDAFMEHDLMRKNWIKNYADYMKGLKIPGNVAECGVYYGENAMFINKYWPDRKLYLFDTFEGFDQKDIMSESNSYKEFDDSIFKNNPFKIEKPEMLIETVKSRMLYPENIEIHKGYFPESANRIDDRFCFVNLDMDLYYPQLAGLRFFWGKMEQGGVILLHDYFHPNLPGTKFAIEEFERELNCTLPKVPIGDGISIAIIKQ